MKEAWRIELAGFPIVLRQGGRKRQRFEVIYGKQAKGGLTYSEAATELGLCIMHALTCEGKLDCEEGD